MHLIDVNGLTKSFGDKTVVDHVNLAVDRGEVEGHERIDLSKVQMFFITLAVVLAYAGAINALMQNPLVIANPFGVALPAFSSSLVLLLGISHGGYLTIKSTAEPK